MPVSRPEIDLRRVRIRCREANSLIGKIIPDLSVSIGTRARNATAPEFAILVPRPLATILILGIRCTRSVPSALTWLREPENQVSQR